VLEGAWRLRSNQGFYFFNKFTHGFKYFFPCSMIKPASTIAASTGCKSFLLGGLIRLACIVLALIGWVWLRASSICCCIFGGQTQRHSLITSIASRVALTWPPVAITAAGNTHSWPALCIS